MIDPTLTHNSKDVFVWQRVPDSVIQQCSPKDLDSAFDLVESSLADWKRSQVALQKAIVNYLLTTPVRK